MKSYKNQQDGKVEKEKQLIFVDQVYGWMDGCSIFIWTFAIAVNFRKKSIKLKYEVSVERAKEL